MKISLGPIEKFPENQVVIVANGLDSIAAVKIDGQIFAYEDSCTHDGEEMGHCKVCGFEVECPRHGARFDVRTGQATRMPAISPLTTYPVTIENGQVYAEVE